MKTPLIPGDKAKFVDDLTLKDFDPSPGADNSKRTIQIGSAVEKRWLVSNVGNVSWENRRLVPLSNNDGGIKAIGYGKVIKPKKHDTDKDDPIIPTMHDAWYSVMIVGKKEGIHQLDFKVEVNVNGEWKQAFPNQKPVYVRIMVTQ